MAHNALLVVVDDLRPNIAAHGSKFMVTPHMDALAASGVLFQRAYAQYSLCGPSRTSFLSGRRPDATRAWSFQNHFREGAGADWTSLPEHFRRNGYRTLAAGKLFEKGLPPNLTPRSSSERTQVKSASDAVLAHLPRNLTTNGWPRLARRSDERGHGRARRHWRACVSTPRAMVAGDCGRR